MKVHELLSALQACNPNAEVAGEWFSPKQGEAVHAHPRRVIQGIVEDRFEMQSFDYQEAAENYTLLGAPHTA